MTNLQSMVIPRHPCPTIVLDEEERSHVMRVSSEGLWEKTCSFLQYITSLLVRKHKKPLFAKAGATPRLFSDGGTQLVLERSFDLASSMKEDECNEQSSSCPKFDEEPLFSATSIFPAAQELPLGSES